MRRGDPSQAPAPTWAPRLAVAALVVSPCLFFWRGTLGRVMLAPVDGLIYSFPQRLLAARALGSGELPLWNPFVFSGFPLFGQLQTAILYPGTWLFLLLSPVAAMNVQMLTAYMIAGLGAYAYTRAIGCTVAAAAFAGVTFGLSGFMIVHMGHVATPQGAAFLPWLVWSVERLRHEARWPALVIGALSLTLAVVAGHPPIPIYLLMVSGLYAAFFALVEPPAVGRWRYLCWVTATLAAGLLLAAVALVPAAELAAQSRRAQMSFADFTSFSLPRLQLPMLVFPFFFGGAPLTSYWAAPNLAELTGYIGIAPLMLSLAALPLIRRNRYAAFWAGLSVFALLLVLGDGTPLGWLMYHVPVYNLFRAQARNFLSFDLAAAVLSAIALTAAGPRALRGGALLVAAGALACVAVAVTAGEWIWGFFARLYLGDAAQTVLESMLTLGNANLLLPLAWCAAALALLFALAWRRSAVCLGLLLALQWADLFVFNELLEQPMASPAYVHARPAYVEGLAQLGVDADTSRVAVVHSANKATDHRLALWGIAMVNGYDPFMLSRYGAFADDMPYWGMLYASTIARHPGFLDLLNARYVAVVRPPVANAGTRSGFPLREPQLALSLRAGESMSFALNPPAPASEVHAVTHLGDATDVPDGMAVARVLLWDDAGGSEEVVLRAGTDTAEWTWDALTDTVRHRRAPIFESFPGGTVEAHKYLGIHSVQPRQVARVRIEALRDGVVVWRLGLRDAASETWHVLTALEALADDPQRWQTRLAAESYLVLENRAALPRAWLVPRTRVLDADAILAAVRDGRLADGERFDPRQDALIEEGVARDYGRLDPAATVEITAQRPGALELSIQSASAAFLVLSEIFYPGWKAYVGGVETPIVRTNYVLRGLDLGPGTHRVRVLYEPASIPIGAAVSVATLLALVLGAWLQERRAARPGGAHP